MLKLTVRDVLERLSKANSDFMRLIEDPRFDLGLYQPEATDPQTPHARDELYIVAAGTGRFLCADETKPFAPGDIFFVSAGVDHRFVDFTPDFATWVIFFGKRI